jgi:hypothetical protein
MPKKAAKRTPAVGTNVPSKKIEGDLVLFVGSGGGGSSCPVCKKLTMRGMVRQYQGQMYCSKTCVYSAVDKGGKNE